MTLIVMTGATRGIGFRAAQRLLRTKDTRLLIGVRGDASRLPTGQGALTTAPLDLADLASVRAFAQRIDAPIDALVLNAGLQFREIEKTKDGFERTFQINHLSHYLLCRLLGDRISPNGRIILTSSGTHNVEERTGMPAPRHGDAVLLAHPERDRDRDANEAIAGRRAYSSSKLCNVMTARELAKRFAPSRPDIAVCAFDPGFTPGTGLARDYPFFVRTMIWPFLGVVLKPFFGERLSSPRNSGRLLAEVIKGAEYAAMRGDYLSVRGAHLRRLDPSPAARNAAACEKMWVDSAAMVGLPP